MRYFFLAVLAGIAVSTADPSLAAGKAKASQLTPEQKMRCQRWEEAKLRNTRMPGTAGPAFCKKS